MTWPTFNPPGATIVHPSAIPPEWRPVVRHDERQRGPQPGRPGLYACAVDVWRDGQHIWRSWVPETGETVDAWTDRELGVDAPRNHDDGLWGVPGVQNIADWPIPTPAAATPGMSMQAISDLLYTLPVIVLMNPAADMSAVPIDTALAMRMSRASRPYIVVSFAIEGISVRALVTGGKTAIAEAPAARAVEWRATLKRREVRAGALDTQLREGSVTLTMPENVPLPTILRHAKVALGVAGWPAQQRDKAQLVWYLARAPYTLTLEPLTA